MIQFEFSTSDQLSIKLFKETPADKEKSFEIWILILVNKYVMLIEQHNNSGVMKL